MNKKFSVLTKNKITKFNKSIFVENDKSISHRALLIASQCIGISYLTNILDSEDVRNTINCLKKLGVKILKKKRNYIVYGNGLGSFSRYFSSCFISYCNCYIQFYWCRLCYFLNIFILNLLYYWIWILKLKYVDQNSK